jgi:SAM-dependent methyltransferase
MTLRDLLFFWPKRRAAPPQRLRWTPALVDRFWNGFAQTKLVNFAFSKIGGRSLIVAIDHLLPRDGDILDYGAGDGQLIKLLCEKGLRAAAYEPSASRARHLRAALGETPGFLGVEGQNISRRFDVVILAEVIEHILDESLDASLQRIQRAVRPGGLVVVTTPNNEDLELGMCYCPQSNMLFHRWQHVRSFDDQSLPALFRNYGFEEVVTHRIDFADPIFVPLDPLWGNPTAADETPDFLRCIRNNQPIRQGNELSLLYVGRRKPDHNTA